MKSQTEIWRELQRVRELNAAAVTAGQRPNLMLHGAEQALGWVIEQLRSPSETEDMMRRRAHRERTERKRVSAKAGVAV